MLAGGVVGASAGAVVALVGANEVFVCHDTLHVVGAACAGGSRIRARMWGAPIGLVIGTIGGLLVARRLVRSA